MALISSVPRAISLRIEEWVAFKAARIHLDPRFMHVLTTFGSSHASLIRFLSSLFDKPMLFGVLQHEFLRELRERNFLQRPTYEEQTTFQYTITDTSTEESGPQSALFEPFLEAMCQMVLDVMVEYPPPTSPWPRYNTIVSIPGQVSRAFLFYSLVPLKETYVMRKGFLNTFIYPHSPDYAEWSGDSYMTAICTPEFLSMRYGHTSFDMGFFQRMGSAEAKSLQMAVSSDKFSFSTGDGITQRTLELQSPQLILVFFMIFTQMCMLRYDRLGDPRPHDPSERTLRCAALFELALVMLADLPLTAASRKTVVRNLPRTAIDLVSQITEEMRCFLSGPEAAAAASIDPSVWQLFNDTYTRCSGFMAYYAMNRITAEIASTTSSRGRSYLFMNGAKESSVSDYIRDLQRRLRFVALDQLNRWTHKLPSTCTMLLSSIEQEAVSLANRHYSQNVDAAFECYRFASDKCVSRTRASIALIMNSCPFLDAKDALRYFHVGFDDGPFIMSTKRSIRIYQCLSVTYWLLTANAVKLVPIFPLIVYFYTTVAPDELENGQLQPPAHGFSHAFGDVSETKFRLAAAICLIAILLFIPIINRAKHVISIFMHHAGVPHLHSANFDMLEQLHIVCDIVFGDVLSDDAAAAAFKPSESTIVRINALRSYVMMDAMHYIDDNTLARVISSARDSNHHLFDVLEAARDFYSRTPVEAEPEGPAAAAAASAAAPPAPATPSEPVAPPTRKRPGRPPGSKTRKAIGRDKDERMPLTTSSPQLWAHMCACMADDNPLRRISAATERDSLLNRWVYEQALTHPGDRALFEAFTVGTPVTADAYYRKPLYPCPSSALEGWIKAAELMKHDMDTGSSLRGSGSRVRSRFSHGHQSIKCMLYLLQLLECVVSSAQPSQAKSRAVVERRQRESDERALLDSRVPFETLSTASSTLPAALSRFYAETEGSRLGEHAAVGIDYDFRTNTMSVQRFSSSFLLVDLQPARPVSGMPEPVVDARECALTTHAVNLIAVSGACFTDIPRLSSAELRGVAADRINSGQ